MKGPRETYCLEIAGSGRPVCRDLRPAVGAWERARGLLGRDRLDPQEGLWIDPCGSIHTVGMRFAIDVLVLDRHLRVLRVVDRLAPWRVLLPIAGARSVVELSAGVALRAGVRVGDTLVATPRPDR